nr:hypothetical protein [Herbaspirillum sp. ASV7]
MDEVSLPSVVPHIGVLGRMGQPSNRQGAALLDQDIDLLKHGMAGKAFVWRLLNGPVSKQYFPIGNITHDQDRE